MEHTKSQKNKSGRRDYTNLDYLQDAFKKSPLFFIKEIWGLVPQPVKPEFRDLIKTTEPKDYKRTWFERFEKGKHITWQQWVILLCVERSLPAGSEYPRRISVKSGHGIGKDTVLSWLILWFLWSFDNSQVPATAPTSEQIHDILWKEISIWLERMPEEPKAKFDWTANYIRMIDNPDTWFARARTARKENPEALAGIHGEHVFMAVDEASGVANEIFTPAEGALTNVNVLAILLGNPRRLIGYFYDTHHADSANWQVLSFNSNDSPIVDREFVRRVADKWGIESDEYAYMVAGEFPRADTVDSKGYVPLFSKDDFHHSQIETLSGVMRKMGIDPAGEGRDKTEWVVRDNFRAKCVASEPKSSPKSVAQKTLTLLSFFGIKPEMIWVDNFGVGANVAQEIAIAKNVAINAVSFNDAPADSAYLNKRAELYFRIKNWMKTKGEMVKDRVLEEQLLTIRYRETLAGKKQIMSKEDMRKEGYPSPDKADALALTFYNTDTKDEETPNILKRVEKKSVDMDPFIESKDPNVISGLI